MTRRGFTLAETLLALGLVLLLFGAMYSFSSEVASSRKRIDTDTNSQRGLTDVLDSIERACLTSIAGDSSLGPGVSGTDATLSIISRSGSQLVRESWKLDEGTGQLMVARAPVELDPSPQTARGDGNAGAPEVWATGIGSLKIRYHTKGQWLESFDSLNVGVLPEAIEVTLWFADAEQRPVGGSEVGRSSAEVKPDSGITRAPDRRRMILLEAPAGGGTP